MSAPYLVTAGGTGGHVFPATALARDLMGRGEAVVFLTDARGARYLPADMESHEIRAKSPSGGLLARLTAVVTLGHGLIQSLALLGKLRPAAVACFGGYASFPASMAAILRRVPIMVHEQNAILGRSNRLVARFARVLALSFSDTSGIPTCGTRSTVTGNPVRPGFASAVSKREDGRIRLLVVGGSQGARVLSDVVPAAVRSLPDGLREQVTVVQQCRPEDLERVRDAYVGSGVETELATFFGDMPDRMAQADLVISRSGASSVSELLTLARPSILIPYQHAADDHQHANAERLEREGAALLLPQAEITASLLGAALGDLLASPEKLTAMSEAARRLARPDAARALGDALVGIATSDGGGEPCR